MLIAISVVLVLCLVASIEIGYRVGQKRLVDDGPAHNTVETAVFALLGLLLAFTFSAAAARFDNRRTLSIDEANAIGTAYLRVDLMPKAEQPKMRQEFIRYIDARLAFNQHLSGTDENLAGARKATAESQRSLWKHAVAVGADRAPTQISGALLPALNQMFDLATSRDMATQTHIPGLIVFLLTLLSLLSGFLAGKSMVTVKGRSWSHGIIFILVIATTIYVISDLEYPRLGLIRLDPTDDLLRSMRDQAQEDLKLDM